MVTSVGIERVKGSFHYIVLQQYFKDIMPVIEYLSFYKLTQSLLYKETETPWKYVFYKVSSFRQKIRGFNYSWYQEYLFAIKFFKQSL